MLLAYLKLDIKTFLSGTTAPRKIAPHEIPPRTNTTGLLLPGQLPLTNSPLDNCTRTIASLMKLPPGQLPPGLLPPGQLPLTNSPGTIALRIITPYEIPSKKITPGFFLPAQLPLNNCPKNNYPQKITPK